MMFVIYVELRIKPGQMDAFLPLMRENAAASLREEPDCMQFDVVRAEGQTDLILLYEVYGNAAAFQTHLNTPHFKHFDAAVASMLASKTVRTGHRYDP